MVSAETARCQLHVLSVACVFAESRNVRRLTAEVESKRLFYDTSLAPRWLDAVSQ